MDFIILSMNNYQEDIKKFILEMTEKYGSLPKSCYNQNKFQNKVTYAGPSFDINELSAGIENFLFGKWLSSGEKVHEFELEFSKKFNNRFSLMVNSGSSANLIMIAALKKHLNWQNNDEIILSVLGFPTTTSALILSNLKPIFIDIEWDTLNFDINLIENKITDKTKGIFISPVLGNPPNFDKISEICDKYKIIPILDNCDSLGSKWKDKYLNEYTIASSCSFFPAHNMTTCEGGMISTNNQDLINITRSMINWGRECYCIGAANLLPRGTCGARFAKWLPNQDLIVDHKYVYSNIGYNLKPLDLQGAIGLEQLKKIDKFNGDRVENKMRIEKLFFKYIKDISTAGELQYSQWIPFGVPIICKSKEQKLKLTRYLEKNSIQTRNYFAGNLLLHPAYSYLDDYKNYPNANKVLELVFFVGCSPTYTEEHLQYIKKILSEYKNE